MYIDYNGQTESLTSGVFVGKKYKRNDCCAMPANHTTMNGTPVTSHLAST